MYYSSGCGMNFGLGKLALLAIKSKEIPGSIFATKKKSELLKLPEALPRTSILSSVPRPHEYYLLFCLFQHCIPNTRFYSRQPALLAFESKHLTWTSQKRSYISWSLCFDRSGYAVVLFFCWVTLPSCPQLLLKSNKFCWI